MNIINIGFADDPFTVIVAPVANKDDEFIISITDLQNIVIGRVSSADLKRLQSVLSMVLYPYDKAFDAAFDEAYRR